MRARISRMRRIASAKPSRASPSPASRARFAAAITAFEGTQPTFRQSPPIRWRSTSATRAPRLPADRRGDETGGAGADDHQVVAAARLGVAPVRRVDVREQRPVPSSRGSRLPSSGWLVITSLPSRRSPRAARGARAPSRRSSRAAVASEAERLHGGLAGGDAARGGAGGVARHAAEVDVEQRPRQHAEGREGVVGEASRG